MQTLQTDWKLGPAVVFTVLAWLRHRQNPKSLIRCQVCSDPGFSYDNNDGHWENAALVVTADASQKPLVT